jgi:hypothetical protein
MKKVTQEVPKCPKVCDFMKKVTQEVPTCPKSLRIHEKGKAGGSNVPEKLTIS